MKFPLNLRRSQKHLSWPQMFGKCGKVPELDRKLLEALVQCRMEMEASAADVEAVLQKRPAAVREALRPYLELARDLRQSARLAPVPARELKGVFLSEVMAERARTVLPTSRPRNLRTHGFVTAVLAAFVLTLVTTASTFGALDELRDFVSSLSIKDVFKPAKDEPRDLAPLDTSIPTPDLEQQRPMRAGPDRTSDAGNLRVDEDPVRGRAELDLGSPEKEGGVVHQGDEDDVSPTAKPQTDSPGPKSTEQSSTPPGHGAGVDDAAGLTGSGDSSPHQPPDGPQQTPNDSEPPGPDSGSPGQDPAHEPPGQAPGNDPPGQGPGNTPPGQAPGNNPPGQAPGNNLSGQSPSNNPPGQSPSNNPPGQSSGNTPGQSPGSPPGQAPGNDPPGQAPGNSSPGQSPQNDAPGQGPGSSNPPAQVPANNGPRRR